MRKLFFFFLITLFSVGALASRNQEPAAEASSLGIVEHLEGLLTDHPEWSQRQADFIVVLIDVVQEPWAYSADRPEAKTLLIHVLANQVRSLFTEDELGLFGSCNKLAAPSSVDASVTVMANAMPRCDCYAAFFDCGGWGSRCKKNELCVHSYWGCGFLWLLPCDGVCWYRPE